MTLTPPAALRLRSAGSRAEARALAPNGASRREGEREDLLPAVDPAHSALFPALALAVLAAVTVRTGFWKLLTTPGASVGDDLSSHFSEIATFAAALRSGSWDLWFDRTQGGYPLLMTYTPLPLLMLGPVLAWAGDVAQQLFLFRCCLLALYLLGPLCWYRGSRGLGLDRLQATCSGILFFFIADQHSFGVGTNSLLCKGLLAHYMACLILPLFLGAVSCRLRALDSYPGRAPRTSLGGGVGGGEADSGCVMVGEERDECCGLLHVVVGGVDEGAGERCTGGRSAAPQARARAAGGSKRVGWREKRQEEAWLLWLESREDAAAAAWLTLLLMANSFTAIFGMMAAALVCSAHATDLPSLLGRAKWLAKLLAVALACNLFWLVRFIAHMGAQGGLPFKHWPNFRGDSVRNIALYCLSGKLADHLGFPLVTLLGFAGLFAMRPPASSCPAPQPPAEVAAAGAVGVEEVGEALANVVGQGGGAGTGLAEAAGRGVAGGEGGWGGEWGQVVRKVWGVAVAVWVEVGDPLRHVTAPATTCVSLRRLMAWSVVMLMGRANVGPLYRALPFHDDVESMRYSIGVHTAAIVSGALVLAAAIKTAWAALAAVSRVPFYRLSAFFTLLFLCGAVTWRAGDARARQLPYSKQKAFDIHASGYAKLVDFLRPADPAPARFLVHKAGSSHYTLNLLPHVSARPGAISYSRGYHDSLSFWHLEHFFWAQASFALWNIRFVVVATKNVTKVPAFFTTVYPACPRGMSLSKCTTTLGEGYSVHEVAGKYGYLEVVSAPLMLHSEQGLKAPAMRHLINNITLPAYERGLIAVICRSSSHCRRLQHLLDPPDEPGEALAQVTVSKHNAGFITTQGIEGPDKLLRAVQDFSMMTLQVLSACTCARACVRARASRPPPLCLCLCLRTQPRVYGQTIFPCARVLHARARLQGLVPAHAYVRARARAEKPKP